MPRLVSLLFLLVTALTAANPVLLTNGWKARWIWAADSDPFGYGVYHFRRAFDLPEKPGTFLVHVTADNRYQLFVNGCRVVWGPARGDRFHWRYESVDIAQHLRRGRNVLAAVVWNDGEHRAVAQISNRTAFLLQGDTEQEGIVNTGEGWVGAGNPAYRPLPVTSGMVLGYVAIPPGEQVDAAKYPWGWERPDFDDSAWKAAEAGRNGSPRDCVDAPSPWFLVPRPIPLMEETPIRMERVRRAEGVTVPEGFLRKPVKLRVPANTRARLLIDQGHLTTAYPELDVDGGSGARVSVRYAEALRLPEKRGKGNRDVIEGKEFAGFGDEFLPDGAKRTWRPLFWRAYRYVELAVETGAESLIIEDLRGVYTGYPFVRRAEFDGGPGEIRKILDVGWRTARLCAHESYMDCPYYEQLQYVGDGRIQALVSLYMTGDHRLMRNAIEQIFASRTSEGATFSRAPSALQQYIPPFSLWWIGMVHDYWWYVDDPEFVREMLPGVRGVLSFFAARQKQNHSLGRMPWWNYVDWVKRWPRGIPPMEKDGSSAPIDLQLLLAYQWAAELEDSLGMTELAGVYRERARELKDAVRALYWDPGRRLFSDTPRHESFSHHANSLAVIAGLVQGAEARELMETTISDDSLAAATIYFRYYLHRAMAQAGLGGRYLDMLDPWRNMLSDGLTTWAEWEGSDSRSDCHAWGASPNIEVFRILLGIDSAAPAFGRVLVQPNLGALKAAAGTMPHPAGEVKVRLERDGDSLEAEVTLPAGVSGDLVWKEERRTLRAGHNELKF